ncbi:uncharacterized protein LOC129940050 [Eupeodes corollae]|uniref:uncharacterized protein LOC129940050 n=1 Tax=Eupeodes corollae TaxID=290404 RepID=UPI0024910E48|nr:uncharacterized protein LOC129940050 [Eupeodes corollae]
MVMVLLLLCCYAAAMMMLMSRPLPHNISQGVIISNHSLVLQGVSRATAGNYSCVGYNAEGDGKSPPFMLNILYAPTCMPNQPRIYGVAKQEDAKIKCTVDANPPDVEFNWTFNNSAESIDVATNHITRSGTSSIVTYTPITELDYGTLLCVASNKIGRQRVPCVFHIIAAGRPDQVHNCTLTNISMVSLTVKCTDGFNGGLPQSFMLEMREPHSNEIRANITSPVPKFSVSALTPGSVYLLSVYAFNSKGRSDPTNMNAAMLRMPEKQLTSEREKPHTALLLSPVLSLTIGLTLAVMVAGFAVVVALRIPCKSSRRRRKTLSNENTSRDGSPGPSDKSSGSKEIDGNESDEKNPDIIPETIDSDDQKIYTCMNEYKGTSSIVTYTPITELDYGTLLCVASNKIGRQRVPCVFHIIAAGRPDQVHNCTLTNISMVSLTVKCTDGFNGGLPQSFMLEMREPHSNEIRANITSPVPKFSVSALTPGSVYLLSVYAFNSKGRSDPTNMNAAMLRMPEKQLTSEREKPHTALLLSPVLSLTIGLTLAVMVAGFAVVVALRIPCKSSRRRRKTLSNENTSRDGSPGPSDKSSGSKEIDGNESDEKNPDIIPETIDSDDQIDYIRRRQHISTIDTSCSPTRGLLSSSTPPPQKYNSSGMTLHSSHPNAMGYCTLRNGGQPPSSVGTLSMNPPPHIYSNSIAQCTLPRHTNHMWPGYSGAVPGVRPLQPIPSLHQLPQQQQSVAQQYQHQTKVQQQQQQQHQHQQQQQHPELSTTNSIPASTTIALQHLGQSQRARICVGISGVGGGTIGLGNNGVGLGSGLGSHHGGSSCLSEDEVTVQTPLMVKRESTV